MLSGVWQQLRFRYLGYSVQLSLYPFFAYLLKLSILFLLQFCVLILYSSFKLWQLFSYLAASVSINFCHDFSLFMRSVLKTMQYTSF